VVHSGSFSGSIQLPRAASVGGGAVIVGKVTGDDNDEDGRERCLVMTRQAP